MASSSSSSQAEVNRIATLNRLKAKQAIRTAALAKERNRAQSPTKAKPGAPLQPESSRNATNTVLKEGEVPPPLKRDSRLGNYFEYDLSKMVNSRGGFLMEDDDAGSVAEAIAKKRREERMKANSYIEPAIDPIAGPRCPHCNTVEIEHKMDEVFGVLVCVKCKKRYPEKYSLLTKTECREDYLLTDDELRDVSILPHMLRPNPHGGTFSNMMLFLRLQVEAYAFAKWDGEEGLDQEFERRETEKRERRDKKFQKGLRELRSRTKNNPYQTRLDAEHTHSFLMDADAGVKRCEGCGFEVEVEVI